MRDREVPDVGKGSAQSSVPQEATPLDRWLDWSSLDALTESILRRIMRVACVVGAVSMASAVLGPQPYDAPALGVGAGATLLVFAATFLPMRVRILSMLYPWALVLVGAVLARMMGPRADPLLLIAGGMFIGSLVLSTTSLSVLSGAVVLIMGSNIWARIDAGDPAQLELWTGSAGSMVAVIVPAAIAGRMLVAALARTLHAREALVREVIADRRKLEETVVALETTRTQLTHAQKLELVSQMAGGIAHDMNNALTAVIGEASLLDDAVAEERERIVEAGAYAAKLTQQLMVFGRRDTSQPRPVDLVATLLGLQQSIRRMMPSDIGISTDFPERPVAVVADPTQLLQVVLNLAANAKDAMPEGGRFTLRLYRDALAGEAEAAGDAVLEVSDSGVGMSDEILQHAFEPFFTTKAPGQGTGLGLANVKQLVEGMGGTVRVHSGPGKGTRFVIRLPTTAAEVTRAAAPEHKPGARAATVLVVDDDVRVRAVAFTALQRHGHRVFEAASTTAALEIVRANAGKIDLLLTDVVMAGGGGALTIAAVREEVPTMAVLVMSGYADDEALRRGIAQGEYPFIAKPFTADALAAAVEQALGSRRSSRESAPGRAESHSVA